MIIRGIYFLVFSVLLVQNIRAQYLSDSLLYFFDSIEVADYFDDMAVPSFVMEPTYQVKAYKMQYQSIDPHGDTVLCSGAIYVPNNAYCDYPVMNFNHGTVLKQKSVPSNLKLDVVGVLAASTGYIVLMPDFMGLGDGDWPHYYMHAESEARSVVDMVLALPAFLSKYGYSWNQQLFLSGYSQGGHVTMAAHQMLEADYPNIPVTASAPMAGPYDLSNTHRALMENDSLPYPQPGYLPYTIFSLQLVYGNFYSSYSEVLSEPYDSILPPMFDGSKKLDAVNNVMPSIPIHIVDSSYYANYLADSLHPIKVALKKNDTYRWSAQAPMRLYHCSGDEVVPFAHSEVAKDSLIARGSTSIELIDVGANYNHVSCADVSVLGAKLWFDGLKDSCINSSVFSNVETSNLSLYRNAGDWVIENRSFQSDIISVYDIQGKICVQYKLEGGSKLTISEMTSALYYIKSERLDQKVWKIWF